MDVVFKFPWKMTNVIWSKILSYKINDINKYKPLFVFISRMRIIWNLKQDYATVGTPPVKNDKTKNI